VKFRLLEISITFQYCFVKMPFLVPQPPFGELRRRVVIYTESNGSANPASYDCEGFLAYFLYLYTRVSGVSISELSGKYPSLFFDQETDNSINDENLVKIDILAFFYFVTVLPKNNTENSKKYRKNKLEGLVKAADNYDVVIVPDDYTLLDSVIKFTRDFLDTNVILRADIFSILISYTMNDNSRLPGASFAIETAKSMNYVYMVGVEMIENILVSTYPQVTMETGLRVAWANYNRFKLACKTLYKDKWIYSGMLAPHLWSNFKQTQSFITLWVLSAGLAPHGSNYRKVSIGGKSIMERVAETYIKRLVDKHTKLSHNPYLPNSIFNQGDAAIMNQPSHFISGSNSSLNDENTYEFYS